MLELILVPLVEKAVVKFDKVTNHVKKHKTAYLCVGTAVVVAGVTFIITRRVYINEKLLVKYVVTGDNNTVNTIYYWFTGDRSGPPSWAVQLKGTNKFWESQIKAVKANPGINQSQLSSHLNDGTPLPGGLEFVRVGVVAAGG